MCEMVSRAACVRRATSSQVTRTDCYLKDMMAMRLTPSVAVVFQNSADRSGAVDGGFRVGEYRTMRVPATFLSFLIACCAGWLQRQQAETIEYLKSENRVLRHRLGRRRLIFTDAE